METVYLLTVQVVKNCPPRILGVYTSAAEALKANNSYMERYCKEYGHFPSPVSIESVEVNQDPVVPKEW